MDHILIDPVQLKLLCLQIIDEPDRVIDPGQRLNNGNAFCLIRFRLFMLVGDIREENIIKTFVYLGFHIMAEIVDPPDPAVFISDAVFDKIHVEAAFIRLLFDGGGNSFIIVRMDHSPEGKAGQSLKFIQRFAAEYAEDSLIGIKQFLRFIGFVDKETARHMFAELFDHRKAFLIQNEIFAEHRIHPPLSVILPLYYNQNCRFNKTNLSEEISDQ